MPPDCEDEDEGVQVAFAWGGPCSQTDNAYPQNNFIWRNQGVGGVAEQIEDAFSGYAVSGCQRWGEALSRTMDWTDARSVAARRGDARVWSTAGKMNLANG